MAADAAQDTDEEPYTWVRCECGAGLWKRFSDHLEMTFVPRAGRSAPRDETGALRRREISVSLQAAPTVSVTCEKCGRVNVPTDGG